MSRACILVLPTCPSVNHYWVTARGRFYISERGQAYRDKVIVLCLQAKKEQSVGVFTGRVAVDIVFHPPDKHRRDLDNTLKGLLDALAHGGVYNDDSQVDDLRIRRGKITKGGEVVVTVSALL